MHDTSIEISGTTEHVNDLSKTETIDDEAPVARGVDVDEIPAGYWMSFRFLGSVASIVLLAVCLYVGFSLPVCVPFQASGAVL